MAHDAPFRSSLRAASLWRCALVAGLVVHGAGAALAQGLAAKAREMGCADTPRVVDGTNLYRCTNVAGFSAYFNADVGGGDRNAKRPAPPPVASTASAPPPANLPRVDAATQKGRDELRRKVLQDELTAEDKLLVEARTAYANGAPAALPDELGQPQRYAERIARLRQSVQLHERNIEALRKELAAQR